MVTATGYLILSCEASHAFGLNLPYFLPRRFLFVAKTMGPDVENLTSAGA